MLHMLHFVETILDITLQQLYNFGIDTVGTNGLTIPYLAPDVKFVWSHRTFPYFNHKTTVHILYIPQQTLYIYILLLHIPKD